jgi:hypothetical protein
MFAHGWLRKSLTSLVLVAAAGNLAVADSAKADHYRGGSRYGGYSRYDDCDRGYGRGYAPRAAYYQQYRQCAPCESLHSYGHYYVVPVYPGNYGYYQSRGIGIYFGY